MMNSRQKPLSPPVVEGDAPLRPDARDLWQLWFDGAAHPNPGRLGLGGVLIAPDGRRHAYSALAPECGCNNEAELLALGRGLELARGAGATHVQVWGDSDFAVRHLNGAAHTDIPRLRALLDVIGRQLTGFTLVHLHWIPRHRNHDADRLSRAALGLPDKPAPRPVSARKRRGRR
ncbi:MAG TPA: ribonuclease HI family protein [Zoogloea sp.]|uniref:ribonuclease HI family protein n=2 Tax=Zoogloea sp. TaxID=49181 RepID=UPI002C23A045|nr:ribonuclease HI family protein [Zoogloea sp.]HMV16599.1 ribonuclease HI family protein [Rhodocyclaceae bacterium]HMV61992.1 ribonuclease HI family protein [Rhodocyclaceae bacterium]HMW53205.1 ribonuclease HI family protein [Rhodocyclaceae bacterium]HMY50746.1 ribonuclease HI family protein [Rhodocyclaceae bacterium]HMZ77157.1 ribonuclease HI family protein [Rhodocyclaceae bacterium]